MSVFNHLFDRKISGGELRAPGYKLLTSVPLTWYENDVIDAPVPVMDVLYDDIVERLLDVYIIARGKPLSGWTDHEKLAACVVAGVAVKFTFGVDRVWRLVTVDPVSVTGNDGKDQGTHVRSTKTMNIGKLSSDGTATGRFQTTTQVKELGDALVLEEGSPPEPTVDELLDNVDAEISRVRMNPSYRLLPAGPKRYVRVNRAYILQGSEKPLTVTEQDGTVIKCVDVVIAGTVYFEFGGTSAQATAALTRSELDEQEQRARAIASRGCGGYTEVTYPQTGNVNTVAAVRFVNIVTTAGVYVKEN